MRGMPAVDRPEYAVPTINYFHFTTELHNMGEIVLSSFNFA